MSMVVAWAQYPEADVASFKVYRSIIGFVATLAAPASVDSKTLELKLNDDALQTVTFSGTDSIIDQVNSAITGGQAYASIADPAKFIFRSDVRVAPGSVEIVGGTALADLGLVARLITEKSESHLIATVPAPVDPNDSLEYEDKDGTYADWYALSTVDSLDNESLKTSFRQPINSVGGLCIVEGVVTDLQGVRVPDVAVEARLIKYPKILPSSTLIVMDTIKTLTGPDGRFSLPLIRGAVVKLEVKEAEYTRTIEVPDKAYEFIINMETSLKYQFK